MPPAYAELGARSNFSLLDGASHPAELVATAKALGHAGIGLCDANSLAGVVRGHVAAKEIGLPFLVGARLQLADGTEYPAWPTDRGSYGRLTALLSRGRMRSPKGECALSRDELIEHAAGWCLALMPPATPCPAFAERLRQDAAALRSQLALPLFCGAWYRLNGGDQPRLERLASMAEAAGAALLASGDVRYHHRDRRRLADVLAAIRLGYTVEALGRAAEPNGERALHSPARMARRFARYPEALQSTLRVLEAGQGFSLDQLRHEYPDEILEPGRTPQQILTDRVMAAAQERWPRGVPDDIQRRIDHELALIEQLHYAAFASPEEVVRRAGIGRKAMEALAQADAFRSLGTSRRAAVWAAQGVENDVPPLLRLAAEQAAVGEPPLLQEPSPDLPVESEGERVVLDYTAIRLTLGQHPLALLRPQLQALGCIDTKQLARLPAGGA
jgi:error-prone DNA polymerase